MKRISFFMLLFVLLPVFWSCSGPEGGGEITALEKSVTARGNTFALEIFPALSELQRDENMLISPFSISTALSMTYNGARGETQTAMAEVLGFSDMSVDDVNLAYKNLTDYLTGADERVTLDIANSIWAEEEFDVLQDFIDVNQNYYAAEVSSLDFSNATSVDIINNWVSNKTQGKIETIIDQIPADVVMYLINALYFKAVWTWEFDPEFTRERPFTCYDGTSDTVNMMSQQAELDYYQNDDFQIVDLPYGDEKFSMTIILPAQDTDINTFIADMTQSDWDTWMGAFPEEKTVLDLYIPRFTFEYSIKLKDILSALGMEIAFSYDADFTGIHTAGGIYINDVYHKTFIEVNEEGTEAAAVTAVEISWQSANPMMMLNRPFLFVIREKETGSIFFLGKFMDPEN